MTYRFNIGQPVKALPAPALNRALEAGERLHEGGPAADAGPPPQPSRLVPFLSTLAKNTDGDDTDFNEHDWVGIKDAALDWPDLADVGDPSVGMVLQMPAVEIEKYNKEKHGTFRRARTMQPIPHGGTGAIAFLGLLMFRLDQTDASHKFATTLDATSSHLGSSDTDIAVWSRGLQDETGDDTKGAQFAMGLVGGPGGGGAVSSDFVWAIVSADIEPATGLAESDWGAGSITVVDRATGSVSADKDIANPSVNKFVVGQMMWAKVETDSDGTPHYYVFPPFCTLSPF